jgi:hypothetical protein
VSPGFGATQRDLRFGREVRLSRRQVNGHGNVFESDQPLAVDLPIAVGHAHGPIDGAALTVCPNGALDAVTESDVAVDGDDEICNRELGRALEMGEVSRPGFAIFGGSGVLPGRYDVEDDETSSGT